MLRYGVPPDLDLLVRPRDVLRAKQALGGARLFMQSIMPLAQRKRAFGAAIVRSLFLAQSRNRGSPVCWFALATLTVTSRDPLMNMNCGNSSAQVSVAGTAVSTLSTENLLLCSLHSRDKTSVGTSRLALRCRQVSSSRAQDRLDSRCSPSPTNRYITNGRAGITISVRLLGDW